MKSQATRNTDIQQKRKRFSDLIVLPISAILLALVYAALFLNIFGLDSK